MQQAKSNRELKVEDALLYLDQVKMEFSDKPHIYNEFLDIMKNFKAQSINTPGVIERVKNLFKGYNKLILGFNTFLPEGEGYKIELTPEEQAYPQYSSTLAHSSGSLPFPSLAGGYAEPSSSSISYQPLQLSAPPSAPLSASLSVPVQAPPPLSTPSNSQGLLPTVNPHALPSIPPQTLPQMSLNPAYNAAMSVPSPQAAVAGGTGAGGSGTMQQAHAIHYVTKIRNRFANEPETYRSFLKILHTYQKEQRGIKEVLEQVSQLFADHSDLLMEFTYFLPDAVQEQAKERLHRAARESDMRKNARQMQTKRKTAQNNNNINNPYSNANMVSSATLPNNALDTSGMNQAKRARLDLKQQIVQGTGGTGMGGYAVPAYAMVDNKAMSGMNNNTASANNNNNIKKQNRRKNELENMPSNNNKLLHTTSLYSSTLGQEMKLKDLSISTERKFFDHLKDCFLSISRESWQEFIKVVDLFTSDIIGKEEMYDLVGELLGNHLDIFHDFKKLIESKVEYMEKKEEMWYAVPLSEIDFTQCRKCTPSYRALPKNYPKPKCTERSEEESKVLNDVWVSIPIGSEESYSFKHMRKNQYEEALFKCEDERFEIDMVIDSNMSTIRILEPLAEELHHIKKLHSNNLGSAPMRFSIQLDKRQLSAIHLNAISRLYGEHAEEILELLKRNPAATIPIILKRLKQKDAEWRKARNELNKQWKDTMQKNHFKSFDHRSFYFKQQDKKYLSTKQLVQEIVSKPPLSFSVNGNMGSGEDSATTGILNSISDSLEGFLNGLTPQMLLEYDNRYSIIHKDIYHIVVTACEHTLTNVQDRERIYALYRELFRSFFNLPLHFLYSNNIYITSSNFIVPKGEAYPIGQNVLTLYGSGVVKEYREEEGMYVVQLNYGKAILNSNAIIGTEQLMPEALGAVGVTRDPITNQDVLFNGLIPNASSSNSSTPNSTHISPPNKIFYGTQMCYIFFRLHHTLYIRLKLAKQLAEKLNNARSNDEESDQRFQNSNMHTNNTYTHFMTQVEALIDNSTDQTRFEEYCRNSLGNKSYTLYTLDKIIVQLMKHLQAMANDENVNKLVGVYLYHSNDANKNNHVDSVRYRQHVAMILSHTMEDVFRIQVMYPATEEGNSVVGVQHLGMLPSPSSAAASSSLPLHASSASLSVPKALLTASKDSKEEEEGQMEVEEREGEGPKKVLSDSEDEDDEEERERDGDGESMEDGDKQEDVLDRRVPVFSPRNINR